jgi:Fe-S-cluster containining protein
MLSAMFETEEQLTGRRLGPQDTLRFHCRPGLACFNSCCRDKRLTLFPYDVLRLRGRLGLPSQELLARHVELEIDPTSGWPLLRLRLEQDGRCPFVGDQGCTVYPDRPTCCRIFPLARAVAPAGDRSAPPRELFLANETPGCLGWQEPRELSLADFLEEQGLAPYQAANNRILSLFMHPARRALTERQTHAVIMALYNLDVFRQAVSAAGFAGRAGLAPDRVAGALQDDVALLDLGQDWLAEQLFGGPSAD